MKLSDLHNKSVAILGFGQEGQAIARFLSEHGISPTIFEARAENTWDEVQKQLSKDLNLKTIAGEGYLSDLSSHEIIFRSPGFWRLSPELLLAEESGSTVTSQAKFFFENCSAKIIGITGTKGKGTTSSLIYTILKASKDMGENLTKGKIYLTGNIGKIQPLDFLDDLTDLDTVVYELSSFQLQDLDRSPDIGICLMVTADHLNHHTDLKEYHEAKAAISKYQIDSQFCIYNIDYEPTLFIGEQGQGQKVKISKQDFEGTGAKIDSAADKIEVRNINNQSGTIDCNNRKIRGKHNLENIAAATAAAVINGVSLPVIEQSIKDFPGLEHRLQFCGEVNGVSYFNDSISTVPETTMAAVDSFHEPVLLILGGSEKGTNYEDLVQYLLKKDNLKAVATIGQTGTKIKQLLESNGFDKPIISTNSDFESTLIELNKLTAPGDVVLLSPASASFDMFKNYGDRGHQFENFVNQLKEK